VLADLLNRESKPGCFWNVNLPHLAPGSAEPEIVFCRPSTQPLPVVYRQEGEYFHYVGEYGSRDRASGTDVDVCFGGNIAVTEISL
jgi:5'-nucleotidase